MCQQGWCLGAAVHVDCKWRNQSKGDKSVTRWMLYDLHDPEESFSVTWADLQWYDKHWDPMCI